MKNLILLILMSLVIKANAQKFTTGLQINYVRVHAIGAINTDHGSGYQPNYEKTELKTGGINLNATFGYNPKFYKFNNNASLGASANIGIGYFFAPKLEGLNGTYILDFPEYVTFRYGRNATDDADKKVGFAIGAGYNYTLNRIPYRGIGVMAEISFRGVAFRFNSNITKFTYYSYYTSEGEKPTYSVLPMGVSILFTY